MNKERELRAFTSNAFESLKKALATSSDEEYIKTLVAWSQGMCWCGQNLRIAYYKKKNNYTEYKFACGHGYKILQIQENINVTDNWELTSLGQDEFGNQKVSARVYGKVKNKTSEEVLLVKKFVQSQGTDLSRFRNDVIDSPIDVIAETEDGSRKEFYQITNLYETSFWKELHTTGAVDLVANTMEPAIRAALERKKNFDKQESKKIILLINTWPGILNDYAWKAKEKLNYLLQYTGFKEIWLVGQNNIKIWPT